MCTLTDTKELVYMEWKSLSHGHSKVCWIHSQQACSLPPDIVAAIQQ